MGVKIASTFPMLSYLLFADDSLIFFRASVEDCTSVKECLKAYELALGQLINFEKSVLSFSLNTSLALVDWIKTTLMIPVVQGHDVYLGLPTFSLSSKRVQFGYLLERVVRKIKGWG
ncbi:uncharacterized protein [Henckelia pumila]|uniref:uncharacterized protein n=1 Tax=Henckelia pumila TaxID=405737 RepID=UPI003C6E1630